jgi:hypothetical protein
MRRLQKRGSDLPSGQERLGSRLPHSRYRPILPSGRQDPITLILDGLSLLLAAAFLIVMLRAHVHYDRWPLFGLLLPAIRLVLSGRYRERLGVALRAQAARAKAFAAGTGGLPWKAAAVLVVIPVFLFDLSNATIVGSIDTRPVIPTAVSLIRDGNWDMSEFDRSSSESLLRNRAGELPKSFQVRGGRIYSSFPSGMVLFATPVTGLARLCGANLDDRVVHLRLEKITASMVAALCLGLFFLTACCLGSAPAAAVATFLLTVSSSLYTTVGLGLWQHGGVVFWTLVALLVEFASSGAPSRRGSVIQGIACAALLMCRPTAALLVAGLGIWMFLRSPRRALFTGAVAAFAYLPGIALYETLYGNPLGPLTIPLSLSGSEWRFGRVDTIAGVFVCPGRGLFIYQPWAVLSLLALVPAVRRLARGPRHRKQPAGWMAYCLIIPVIHCLVISAWHDWSGGYCWGSRLLTDIIPLLGLLSVPAIEFLWQSPRSRTVIFTLAVLGALTHIPCTYMGASSWNYATDHDADLWSWSNAPFLYHGSR